MIEIATQFDEIYKKYFHNINRYLRAKGLPEDVANDITTDTFLRLFEKQKRCKFDAEKPLSVWLYKTAAFFAKEYLRSKRRKIEDTESGDFDHYANLVSDENTIDQSLEAIQLSQYVKQFETHLTPSQKQLFYLSLQEDKTDRELCAELNINETALRSRKYRLRKILKQAKQILLNSFVIFL